MKALLQFLFIAFCLLQTVQAQPLSYDASTVPEKLKKNAAVVKRYENSYFEVTDIDRARLSIHQVYTVFNEAGDDVLTFTESSDKLTSLDEVEIKVYDAKGKQIQRYKKKDLTSMAVGEGLVPDGVLYGIRIPTSTYPITVEYIYEIRFRCTLFYPRFAIIVPEQGVEKSSFVAKVPKDMDLRFKAINTAIQPEITGDTKTKTYKWSVSDLAPIEFEPGSIAYSTRYPSVILAPNRFKIDDYEGDMSSWKNFGNWYNALKKDLDILPENRKVFFKELVKNSGNDREKIKLIYDYLQKNFRYVSIQLGIGGFKPFPATFTDQKKYGDCKGLSNYMQAALNAVGIKSYQVLINRQTNGSPVDPNFPSNSFNHVILMVPDKKDSIWLECTSTTLEFGKLDITTQNRYALVVTEQGGQIVATPVSKAEENVFSSRTEIALENTGTGKISTTLSTSGEYREDIINYIFEQTSDNQKKYIMYGLGYKQPDDFEIEKLPSTDKMNTRFHMQFEKVPEFIAGTKMFLSPRMYRLSPSKMPKTENRTQDFYFGCPFVKDDTTIYSIPEGYIVETLPKPKEIKCELACFSTNYWYDEKTRSIYSNARIRLDQQKIPVSKFAEVKKFFDDVVAEDGQRIVIKKG